MLIEQVDAIGLQAPQGGIDHFAYMLGLAVGSSWLSVHNVEAEFGSDERLVAASLESASNQFFVAERSVNFSRVKEVESSW